MKTSGTTRLIVPEINQENEDIKCNILLYKSYKWFITFYKPLASMMIDVQWLVGRVSQGNYFVDEPAKVEGIKWTITQDLLVRLTCQGITVSFFCSF